jgi:transcriptional regulator
MYIPSSFEVTDKEALFDFIEHNSFAVLFSQKDNLPFATHLPFIVDRENQILYSHMARVNPHWQDIDTNVLIVFSGPHTYISPAWYEMNQAVPTWNYTAVHLYGTFRIIEEDKELTRILHDSVAFYESAFPEPWELNKVDPHFIENLSKGIVGFKIDITKMEGKWKLSQNHSKERQEKVINALETFDDDNSKQIAGLMKSNLLKLKA